MRADVSMNHRQVLELAGWLAEHGPEIVVHCRGIPVAALRRYLKARQTQFQAWSEILLEKRSFEEYPQLDGVTVGASHLLTTIRDVAPHGILVRVASTVLYSIGERLDIPLAQDVANQTARAYGKVIQTAMASVALHMEIPASELSGLDRLGRLCDRLSDVLCGALLPALKCDRFVVDRELAADFAQTFGRQPPLVRVPLRKAALVMPSETPFWTDLAAEVERALLECLPILMSHRSAHPDKLTDLVETFAPKILRLAESQARIQTHQQAVPTTPLTFPSCSFAKILRKVRDQCGD